MATTATIHPNPPKRSDSDVSPRTVNPPKNSASEDAKADYFPDSNTVDGSNTSVRASDGDDSSARKSSISFAPDPRRSSSCESNQNPAPGQDSSIQRKSSTGSVSFRRMTNPQLPQGNPQQMSNSRIRASSPNHSRFMKHVAFDNVTTGEPTKNNAISFTLNVRHKGYQARRRSRCFMVGVDEHTYSDYALQWLLDELVDDGDDVVCVRVVEKELRLTDKQYRDDADSVMKGIVARNGNNRAINIVLEYAVGKLHTTFQHLIQMYQPAMLIVGTRGRTLGGLQGLVNTRNSFSKYCLQYSPVPVVVVRPTEKRIKKKAKRANDSARQTYVSMLAANAGKHEADSEASSTYELEVHNSPDEEAHQVARALGLPASFDPTIKPLNHSQIPSRRSPDPTATAGPVNESSENQRVVKDDVSVAAESDDDDSDDDDSGEFEVMSGQQALDRQKMDQLHKMEVGEAAAFKMKMKGKQKQGTDNNKDKDSTGDEVVESNDKSSQENNQLSQVAQPDSEAKGGLSSLEEEGDTTELQHLDDLQKRMAVFDIGFHLSRGACNSKVEDKGGPSSPSFEKPDPASKALQVPSGRQIRTSSTGDQASSTLVGSSPIELSELGSYRSQPSAGFFPSLPPSNGDSGEEVQDNGQSDGGDGDGDGASSNNNNNNNNNEENDNEPPNVAEARTRPSR
ncbi:Universal stress A family [Fusarium acutatum]|uniref:Universal stress A family n=1 Tax=Fusarium acutatum TaxID=78861 RepID=A0A8H4NMT0_9HYPO|nr:Universal stress A family [Fusarium acutatum]